MTTFPDYTANGVSPRATVTALSRTNSLNAALNRLNALLSIKRLLYLFWGCFWLLNGLDKFFNGYLINGKNVGWFGVYRDPKMIAYFERLFLPPEMALTFLYCIGIFETILGTIFLIALFFPMLPKSTRHLAFKASFLIFVMFSVGDILFGDRAELWEHGTFMILTISTFRLYLNQTLQQHDSEPQQTRWPTPPLQPPLQVSKPRRLPR